MTREKHVTGKAALCMILILVSHVYTWK